MALIPNAFAQFLLSSDNKSTATLKVSTVSSMDAATADGRGYAGSFQITVPANTEWSVKLSHNSKAVVRFTRAPGLYIEYYYGDVAGELVQLAAVNPMNANTNSGFEGLLEFYDQHPTGERVVSNADAITDAWYVNGSTVLELSNETDAPITTFFSMGIEDIGTPVVPFGLLATTALTSTTEMGDYNG